MKALVRLVVMGLLCFSFATLVAGGIIAAYVKSKWAIDRQRLEAAIGALRGETPATTAAAETKPAAEMPSFDQIVLARAVRDKNLQLRELALENDLSQLQADRQKVADDRGRYETQRAAYAKELAAMTDAAAVGGRDEVRRILTAIKPAQAKAILLAMLEDKETKEVVALLSGMTDTKRAKILAEFKSADDSKKIDEVLRLIRQGEPQASVANRAREQLEAKPGGT